jgi:predicted ATPase
MGSRNAFRTGLPGGTKSSDIDNIKNTSIEYSINGHSVVYRYNNTRWSATPKKNSTLVGTAFTEVLFLKADSSRVEPTQQELRRAKRQQADLKLKEFLNSVFDSLRFHNLYQVRLPGRGLIAHLVEKSAPTEKKKAYYSEKHFSLGELCVMRLGQKLLSMKRGGLYIIDEFEMALHPAAQIRLFGEIEKLSKLLECTVLVSTHSSSLIKSVTRSNLIYLENDSGEVTTHRMVYPAYALQHISLEEESAPDKLIFVEDTAAKHCVEAMWRHHLTRAQTERAMPLPTVKIVIVGGYKEVIRFLIRSKSFVPPMTRRIAALDADAQHECIPSTPSTSSNPRKKNLVADLYNAEKHNIQFLPWTPEVGFCNLISKDLTVHNKGIRQITGITNFVIPLTEVSSHLGKPSSEQRQICKAVVQRLALEISRNNNWPEDRAKESLFSYLVRASLQSEPAVMKQLIGKLFN